MFDGMPSAVSLFRLRPRSREPWFSSRPGLALVVIAALFAAVLALRLLAGTPVDALSMLYVLPVALAASAFGQRGGVTAGLLAVALIVIWALARDVTLDPAGWGSRVVPLVLLGVLVGRATDRAREAEAERRRHEVAALLHQEAIEINDSLIQGMTAAKWSLESGQADAGLQTLTTTVREAQQLVSGLIRRANMGGRSSAPPVPPPSPPEAASRPVRAVHGNGPRGRPSGPGTEGPHG